MVNNDQVYGRHCARKGTTVAKELAKIERERTAWMRVKESRNFPLCGELTNSTYAYVVAYYARNFCGGYNRPQEAAQRMVARLFGPLSTASICYPEGPEVIYSEDPDYKEPAGVGKKRTKAQAAKELAQGVLALDWEVPAALQALAREVLK